MAAFFCSKTAVMSTKTDGMKPHSSGWWGSKTRNSLGGAVLNPDSTPAPEVIRRAFWTIS
ncbi:hypothetical protein ACFFX0_21995 [Citricoccus parietis]|uniref:Uncharacterized protein n=1 Tax=Citricoccus parietis TaxID=592307 RepID=A0ABV5G476_9MICC